MDQPFPVVGPPPSRRPRDHWGTLVPLLHRSISDIPEKELVAHVLSDSHHRQTLFNIKGLDMRSGRILREIDLQGFRSQLRGDIDILVLPANGVEQTTAIQVKRFKIGAKAVRTGMPNGLQEFRKGVRQANDLARLGFFQVYLWVFVVADTREQNQGRYSYEGPNAELRSRVRSAISTAHLDPRVGLMLFEWVQPMDRAPFALGSYGASLQRLASPASQSSDVTDWLNRL